MRILSPLNSQRIRLLANQVWTHKTWSIHDTDTSKSGMDTLNCGFFIWTLSYLLFLSMDTHPTNNNHFIWTPITSTRTHTPTHVCANIGRMDTSHFLVWTHSPIQFGCKHMSISAMLLKDLVSIQVGSGKLNFSVVSIQCSVMCP